MMLSYSLHYSYLSVKQFLSSVNRSALLGFDESKNNLLQSERMETTNKKTYSTNDSMHVDTDFTVSSELLCAYTFIYIFQKKEEKSMKFLPNYIDPAWQDFLTDEIREELYNIEQQVGENYNPTNPEYILRFLTVPLDEIKIIWLGQDVYPAEGVATGRAFEVGHLDSWQAPFRQASLRNIVRLIHKNYHDIKEYESIQTFQKIRKEI